MNYKAIMIMFQVLPSLLAHGQDSLTNNILTTKTFRYGIYESFREFRDNAPSVTDGFTITTDGEGKYLHYRILNKRGRPISAYGFSDGKVVYICAAAYSRTVPIISSDPSAASYKQTSYFMPVLIVGEICYLEDFVARSIVGIVETQKSTGAFDLYVKEAQEAGERIAQRNPGWVIYLPDDDGYVYLFDKKTIGSILKIGAKDLYEEFKNAEGTDSFEVLMSFLLKFNKRNDH